MTTWTSRTWSSPLADPEYREEVKTRIASSIAITDRGCWEWQKYRTPDGYGVVSIKRRMTGAHQVMLAIFRGGLWPDELQVDHLCANRACCNPNHLELVTSAENTRRGYGPAIAGWSQRSQVACKSGHPFDPQNTYWNSDGHRKCRACRAAGERRRRRLARTRSEGEMSA